MSQYGAYAMAQLGFAYDEICEFYFPGTKVDAYLQNAEEDDLDTDVDDVDSSQDIPEDVSNVSQDMLDGVDDHIEEEGSQDVPQAEAVD